MSYDPDQAAIPHGTQFTRQLSQRDVSLQIPVNFVTAPGVILTQACFSNKRYEDSSAVKCFSNLLASGFQRLEVDIFWDVTREVWSLCPVELGHADNLFGRRVTSLQGSLTTSSTQATENGPIHTAVHSVSTSETIDSNKQLATSTMLAKGPATAAITHRTEDLIEVGPYSCTSSANFELLVKVMASHLYDSQFNVNATMKYLILNLRASSPASDPSGNSNKPLGENLPAGKNLLSAILVSYMSEYLYTPYNLQTQRSDLNSSASWYAVPRSNEPDSAYFRIGDGTGHASTPDGWPSESFVEMERGMRVLAGFGHVDSQMDSYDLPADASVVFPQHYLQSQTLISANTNGDINAGCFFRPERASVSSTNNSWAINADDSESSHGFKFEVAWANNLTLCGISPVLNETLGNMTADQGPEPYLQYVQSTIWSWGPGEPQHHPDTADGPVATQSRCAVIDASTGYWRTEDCGESHFCACRKYSEPYEWAISRSDSSYTDAGIMCNDNTEFTVPRTALENRYLLHVWRQFISDHNVDDNLLWVNFNDLDAKSCWVTGQNSTCPYRHPMDHARAIAVPTVAAVIVFVLAALTVFVKCTANRRRSRSRRRRGDDGWDYEGVPS